MKVKFLLLLILCILSISVVAQRQYKSEFGFQSDNDAYLFYGEDQYYTNGLMIYYRRATNQRRLGKRLEKFIYELSAGQKMFNPSSGSVPNKSRQDRPFAGYLYGGIRSSFFYKKENILSIALETGTVGSNSLAEAAQKFLHKTVGFYEIAGWEYQIQNGFSANLSLDYTKLLSRARNQRSDFALESYLHAGTTFSGAGLGILFRAGNINQLFQTAYTHSLVKNQSASDRLVKNESFIYLKPQLNYVAYDATIQGGMFSNNSPLTFGVKPWVFAQQIGYNYSSERFTIDFGMLFKTKEVKSRARAHQYGSISLYYRFN